MLEIAERNFYALNESSYKAVSFNFIMLSSK